MQGSNMSHRFGTRTIVLNTIMSKNSILRFKLCFFYWVSQKVFDGFLALIRRTRSQRNSHICIMEIATINDKQTTNETF